MGSVNPPTLFFFFKIVLSIWVPCISTWILRSACQFLQKKLPAGILKGLALNPQINLESFAILTLSLSIHEHGCLSIYLGALWFFSTLFCSFQCMSYISLSLLLSILFFFDTIINEIVFLTSFSDCSLLVYKMQLIFVH